MTTISNYEDSPTPAPLVADLAQALALSEAEVISRGPGWAILRDGRTLDWTDRLDQPVRAQGVTLLDTPADFAAFATRHQSAESVVFADKRAGRLTAVFNGPAATEAGTAAVDAEPGFGDHRAVVNLVPDEDWTAWVEGGKRLRPQAEFGELIEGLAHTMVDPDGARMLEIALTLTARSKIDYSSRARLDNGDVSFRFEQDTTVRAGKGATEIEVPQSFIFAAPVWEGTDPVEVSARLRVKPGPDGVLMGYRIMRLSSAIDDAFGSVIDSIEQQIPDGMPIFRGAAPGDRPRY